ncbi:MAG: DUF559 domain-containing protein [Ilumatobacteraceae bacterium]
MLRDGRLVMVFDRVARLSGSPETPAQRIRAATLALPDSIASHRSAATVWGAAICGIDPVDVIVARQAGRGPIGGIRLHHPRDRGDLRPVWWNGIPVTNPLRTLLDLGAVAPHEVVGALECFVVAGWCRPTALDAALARHARPGRNGIGALRRALRDFDREVVAPDSVLELRVAAFLRRHRLPPATFHARVAGFEVDFLIDDSPIVLECEGWRVHGRDREQFEFDRARHASLVAAGHVVVRITWRALTTEPERIATEIRDAVQTWAPHLTRPPR